RIFLRNGFQSAMYESSSANMACGLTANDASRTTSLPLEIAFNSTSPSKKSHHRVAKTPHHIATWRLSLRTTKLLSSTNQRALPFTKAKTFSNGTPYWGCWKPRIVLRELRRD